MTSQSKFVPMVLAITLLVLPAAGVSTCRIPMLQTHGMMMTMSDPSKAESMSSSSMPEEWGTSCCELSATNAPPALPILAVNNLGAIAATTSGLPVASVPPVVSRRIQAAELQRYRTTSSLQTLLCVFLI